MSTITTQQAQAIADFLAVHDIPKGLGTKKSACSIAAINLALTGKLTDDIPDCMSEVIGSCIIQIQDAMPHEIRNSQQWKQLLPSAAGTGRDREKERMEVVLDWMWTQVLPTLQALADENGFGAQWKSMCETKTYETANTATSAADDIADIAYTANTALYAARAADTARYAAAAVDVARYVARYAAATARAARTAGVARAADVARYADVVAYWNILDPCGLLQKLIEV